ncbi:hypothetical protein SLE2022_118750 [Rubroshorea leprosula]
MTPILRWSTLPHQCRYSSSSSIARPIAGKYPDVLIDGSGGRVASGGDWGYRWNGGKRKWRGFWRRVKCGESVHHGIELTDNQ